MESSFHDQDKLIWTFGGGKGGAGRTLLSTTLGILLSRQGKDVVLLDANLDSANTHTALGMRPPQKNLSDFIKNKTQDLNEIAVPSPFRNVRLISSAGDSISAASPSSAPARNRLVKKLGSVNCAHLLVDLGPGLGFWAVDMFLEGSPLVLVTTPEPTSVETTYRFIRTAIYRKIRNFLDNPEIEEALNAEFTGMGSKGPAESVEKTLERIHAVDKAAAKRISDALADMELKLVVNQTMDRHDKHIGPSICEIVNKFYGVRMDYAGFIPFDERVALSLRRGRPFIAEYETSETAACFSVTLRELLNSASAKNRKRELKLIKS